MLAQLTTSSGAGFLIIRAGRLHNFEVLPFVAESILAPSLMIVWLMARTIADRFSLQGHEVCNVS